MVAFNPGEQYATSPTPDPEYTSYRWSRTIPEPGANKSGEILAKGLGSAVAEGAEGTNKIFETAAANAARDAKEESNTKVIDDLQNTLDAVKGAKVASNNPMEAFAFAETEGRGKLDLLSSTPQVATPQDVKDSARIAEGLKSARANGTFSHSYGDMIKDSYLKKVRADYPGYRNIVDRNFGDPANERISSLLGDLNSWAKTAEEGHKQLLTDIRSEIKEGTPLADVWMAKVQDGSMSSQQAYHLINQANTKKYEARIAHEEWSRADDTDKLAGLKAEKAAQTKADSVVSTVLNTMSAITNTGDAVAISKVLSGDIASSNFDSTHSQMIGQQFQDAEMQVRAKLDQELHAVDKDTGKSISSDMKEEAIQKLIDARVKPLVDYRERFTNHEHGLANLTKMVAEGYYNNTLKQAYEDPNLGSALQKIKVLRETVGPAAEPMVSQWFAGAGQNDLSPFATHWVFDKQLSAATQTNYPKEVTTVNDQLAAIQADPKGDLSKQGPALAKNILGWSARIGDTKLPVETRANYARAFFNDIGVVDKFAPASVDARGRRIPGQMDVFQTFGTAKFAATMRDLADQGHPELWDTYQHFMEESFGSPNRGLFAQHVRTMSDNIDDPSVLPLYHSDTNHFSIAIGQVPKGPTLAGRRPAYPGSTYGGSIARKFDLVRAGNMVKELNKGIDTMKNIYGNTAEVDMNANLLQLFQRMGMDPKSGSFGAKMYNALITANKKEEPDASGK